LRVSQPCCQKLLTPTVVNTVARAMSSRRDPAAVVTPAVLLAPPLVALLARALRAPAAQQPVAQLDLALADQPVRLVVEVP
jgi:hypothetical protein